MLFCIFATMTPYSLRSNRPIILFSLACGFVLFLFAFIWFGWRVSPKEGEIVILVHKTGKNPPPGSIIAGPGEKGIQLEVLSEGRYFFNPFTWSTVKDKITDIPAGKVGVLVRLYGKENNDIVAGDGMRGIVAAVLPPGKHRINPYAYNVEIFDATTIRPGHIGVQVALTGKDPLTGGSTTKNNYIVETGTKGVIEETLDPGSYYLNPYLFNVIEVNMQSQRFEMSGDDSIDFTTEDGFPVKVEGTVEYAVVRAQASRLTHVVGDLDDILRKIILPRARGFARLEGSKGPALNYIVGEMRQQFQDRLEKHLREQCTEWGVEVRSVLIRNITPPEDITSIIRARELAKQTRGAYTQQITQATSKAELVRQEGLAAQNTTKVEAQTVQAQAKILAEQELSVALTGGNQRKEVASLQKQSAEAMAATVLAEAHGKQAVIKLQNEADAAVLSKQSEAFGGGVEYARYLFLLKTAPSFREIITNDSPDGLGALFNMYLPSAVTTKK